MERNAVRPSRCSNPWESYPKKGREGVSLAEEKYYERLQEAWRAGRGDRSNQEIADAAGLAKSTVDYLFSVKSSDPKLSTAAAMSRELCASMDRAFNVVSAEEKREETEIVLETKLRAAERAHRHDRLADLLGVWEAPNTGERDIRRAERGETDKREPLEDVVDLVVQFHVDSPFRSKNRCFGCGLCRPSSNARW